MDETRSFFPRQRVTRAQAVMVYREVVRVLRAADEAKGETFDKAAFDEHCKYFVDSNEGMGPFPRYAIGRWVGTLLSQLVGDLTTHETKMSQHCEEWGAFLSGGHTYYDSSRGVAEAVRITELAGLEYEPATLTRYATGWSC